MSKLLEAVIDIASKLDPSIDLGLSAEFGDDWQEQLSEETKTELQKIIEKYTIKELKALARKNKIKNYSKLSEDDLIKLLQDNRITL